MTVKKKGKCKITVTSIYDSKVKGTLSLTVSKGKQKAKITLKEKKASIVVGKTTTIKVKSFKGISNKNIAFPAFLPVTFPLDDTVATFLSLEEKAM